MKYGLLCEMNTGNIGDDIQSYASKRFLPRVDYFIDRENLDKFVSRDNETVLSIFNAWFLNNKLHWPPANSIIPLCIAMHFAIEDPSGLDLGLSFLEGLGGDYLRHYGSIGCRDTGTAKMLNNMGINAYFSGCLTLTLPKQKLITGAKPYICLVDVHPKVYDMVKKQVINSNIELLCISHHVEIFTEWNQKEDRVVQLLEKYQNALCVITSRLHCALPCLAMEVPVLFLEDQPEYRTADFLNFLTHTTTNAFCQGNFTFSVKSPPQNSDNYVSLRKMLIKTVEDFICEAENNTNIQYNRFMASDKDRYEWKINLLSQQLLNANTKNKQLTAEINEYLVSYCDEKNKTPSIKKLLKYNIGKLIHNQYE